LPSHFLLCGKPSEADTITAALLANEAREEQREQTNLLYVAITRAKQLLFISGCKPKRGGDLGWYGAIAVRLGGIESISQNGWSSSSGTPPHPEPVIAHAKMLTAVDSRLALPLPSIPVDIEIAPSRSAVDRGDISGNEEGLERGRAIHRFLQLLSGETKSDPVLLRRRVINEFGLEQEKYPVKEWQAEAEGIVNHPAFREWFDESRYDSAFNEVPLCYYRGERLVHGVIDRLVVNGDRCVLIDYKTHRGATPENIATIAAAYREQLQLYAEGLQRLWPDKTIRSFLLFTACASAYTWQEKAVP
jgi:ATP-dependent helicase/nuclease subunit A